MLLRDEGDSVVCIGQASHAWVSGQLARAWGGDAVAPLHPREEVCLGAEQHDVGMAEWDLAPALNPRTGRPRSFVEMELPVHLALWSAAPAKLLTQSHYAALLVSVHGTIIYGRSDLSTMNPARAEPIRAFLAEQREVQAAMRAELGASEEEIARNGRLVFFWDWLSLALCLRWPGGDTPSVPLAAGIGPLHYVPTRGGRDALPLAVRGARAARRVRGTTPGGPLRRRAGDARRARCGAARAPGVPPHTNARPGIPDASSPVSHRCTLAPTSASAPSCRWPRTPGATASSGTCSRV